MTTFLPFGGQVPLCQQDNCTLAAGFLGCERTLRIVRTVFTTDRPTKNSMCYLFTRDLAMGNEVFHGEGLTDRASKKLGDLELKRE